MVRVRMADVAARAGVSTATVSMVLNGVNSTRISPQTQQRVREAAGRAQDLADIEKLEKLDTLRKKR